MSPVRGIERRPEMKQEKGPWKFGGRASKEVYVPETGRHICTVHFAALQAMTNINFNEVSLANAHLIALAPTAPHSCDDPDCPGAVNKAKLETFPEMLEALRELVTAAEYVLDHGGDMLTSASWYKARAVLAKIKEE